MLQLVVLNGRRTETCFLVEAGGPGGNRFQRKDCLFILMDANARTGQRMEGYGNDESRVLVQHTDVLFVTIVASDRHRLQVSSHQHVSQHMGRALHTHNGTSPNDRGRMAHILSRQTHRPRVQGVKVVPQIPSPQVRPTQTTMF